jgi:hypothetical protein
MGQPSRVARACAAVLIVLTALCAFGFAYMALSKPQYREIDAIFGVAYFATTGALLVLFTHQRLRTIPQADDERFPVALKAGGDTAAR